METEQTTSDTGVDRVPATPIQQAKSRLAELEQYVTELEPRLATAFNEVDEALTEVREDQDKMLTSLSLAALAIDRSFRALQALVAEPNNPNHACSVAREILEEPLDLDALAGSDAVAGEPEGDPPADA